MFNRAQNRVFHARRRAGVTLIEVAMSIAVMAIVVAFATVFWQNANNNQKLTNATQQLSAVQQAVQGLYAGQPSKAGLETEHILKSLPASMVSGNTIRNPYNGVIEVAAVSTGFTVRMTNLPVDACHRLAVIDTGRQTQSVAVGSNNNTTLPVTPVTAQTQCTNNVAITWTFY